MEHQSPARAVPRDPSARHPAQPFASATVQREQPSTREGNNAFTRTKPPTNGLEADGRVLRRTVSQIDGKVLKPGPVWYVLAQVG